MKIETDEFRECLVVDGEEFSSSEDHEFEFEVLASSLRNARLSDLPHGISIRLYDRVIGSNDLYPRSPFCSFEHTEKGNFVCHVDTVFISEKEDVDPDALQRYFEEKVAAGKQSLEPLARDGILIDVSDYICEEIAYFFYSILLCDQSIPDAEIFVAAVEERVYKGCNRSLLFVCHASEDNSFTERLVAELDRRALHAWFDKREILVGESIVERVNDALSEVRFVVVILSPRSVRKPWVLRELNSTLMRQLAREHISMLPVLLEDCDIPPLLKDLKYADFRVSFDKGFGDLLAAIRSGSGERTAQQ